VRPNLLDGYLAAQRRLAEERGRGADPVHEAGLTGEQTGEQIGVEAEKPVG